MNEHESEKIRLEDYMDIPQRYNPEKMLKLVPLKGIWEQMDTPNRTSLSSFSMLIENEDNSVTTIKSRPMAEELAYYGWVFTKNPYTSRWRATTSEHKEELFSGGKHVVQAKEMDSIEAMIIKHDGSLEEILKHIEELT